MKIGVYGGSFNPPHNGHLMLANQLSRRLQLDRLIIIPSNISPQKSNNGNIDPMHRIKMCEMLFSDDIFTVSDCEIKRGGRSFTVDTLTHLKNEYPDAEFYLFMGSDMLLSFNTWYRFRDILSMCTVCAISREDEECTERMREYARKELDESVVIFDIEPFQVSSSEIRANILSGASNEGLLSREIIEYIKENGLYGQ